MELSASQSLMKYLDEYRPDKPPCEDTMVKDMVNGVLTAPVSDGEYQGLTYIQALTLAKMKHAIEHPESVSLGDISKVSADRKAKMEVEAGDTLRDMFSSLKMEPSEVVVLEEGHKHGGGE